MKYFLLLTMQFMCLLGWAQRPEQSIRGHIYDDVSGAPIEGVEISLKDTEPAKGAVTDSNGAFELAHVPVGRYIVLISHIGYQSQAFDLVLEAGRPFSLEVKMEPSVNELDEVVIKEEPYISNPNEIGNRSVTIEQSNRFAANYMDPARVMMTFPGVMPQNDQNNNLIINGKSPNSVQWRLQGMDIVNPNHLANAGTISDQPALNGGGVNMISTQMLSSTDFMTPVFSGPYGSASSAIVNMNFRPGDKYENHYTLQASLIGIDVAAEGPIKKEKSSFLANYRYSTVGLLSKMGVDFGGEEIDYQDFSFNYDANQKKGGKLNIFGAIGTSNNDFTHLEFEEWEYDKDSTDVKYHSTEGVVGVTELMPLSSNTSLFLGTTFSGTKSKREGFSVGRDGERVDQYQLYEGQQTLWSNRLELSTKFSNKVSLQTGAVVNISDYEIDNVNSSELMYPEKVVDNSVVMVRPYATVDWVVSQHSRLKGGVQYYHTDVASDNAVLPSVSYNYTFTNGDNFVIQYGIQAQRMLDANYTNHNELKAAKFHHAGIGYNMHFKNHVLFSEVFYEHFYDVPVTYYNSPFSALNVFGEIVSDGLVNDGVGNFKGVNLSLERPMQDGYYYIFSTSFYDATYEGKDGLEREARFNGKYTISLTGGKDIYKEKDGGVLRTIGLNGRAYYAGGHRDVSRGFYYNEDRRLDDYKRLDLRITFKKEKPNYTRTIGLDLQNVFSFQNEWYEYYDARKGEVVTKNQLGIIPVILYKVEF